MPSPTGAVSAGLLASLNGVARKVGGGTNDIDTALASGNKLAEVTKHCVEFQLADCQQSNTLLKSKYVFLDTKHAAGGASVSGIKSLPGSANGTKDAGNSNGSILNGITKSSNGLANSSTNGSLFNGAKSGHQNGISHGNGNGFIKNVSPLAANVSNGIKRIGSNGFLNKHSTNGNGGENGALKPSANSESTLPEPKHVLYDPENVTLGWSTKYAPGAGMVNLGNTCYLNATLQALFHVPAFVKWLMSDTDHMKKCEQINGQGYGDCITCSMARTFRMSQNHMSVKPYLITNKLRMICRHMSHGSQEDAHEFMRHLLENMEKGYINRCKAQKYDPYSKETTPINQIFGGYIRTEVKCLKCNFASTTFQHIQDMILDIRKASKVEEAMDQYFSKERLDGDNAYKCEKCKCLVPAIKKFSIERPPKVLCIQLKRFNVNGLKIPKPVEHRIAMNLRRHVHPQSSFSKYSSLPYRLISMVTHVGATSGSGHYTAIAQCCSGTFHLFDDTSVRPVSVQTVLHSSAYILIYEMDPNFLNQSPKPAAASSQAPFSSLGNSNHSTMSGTAKSTAPIVGGLPSAKDRDRVAFGLTAPKPQSAPQSAPPRLVIHSKKVDGSSLVPTLKGPNVQNGFANKEARPSNFIGPVQVVANGKHLGSPVLKERPSLPGTSKQPDSASSHLSDTIRSDIPLANNAIAHEKRPFGSLVPYGYDDDSSSRESSLSPPLDDEQEVLTVKATTPSGWQVTNSSGLRSPSIHSESSNHSVASATGANWNVTEKQPETQSMGSKTTTVHKVKDRNVLETSPQTRKYSSDPEESDFVKMKSQRRVKIVERSFNLADDTTNNRPIVGSEGVVSESSVSSESDSSSSRQLKKKPKVTKQTEHNRLPDGNMKRQDSPSGGSQYNRFNPPPTSSRYADNPVSSAQRGNPSNATWNGDRNTNTVNDLLKMSHQGFGERVSSWNGEQSWVERNSEEERQASRKRPRDEYEMELDRGRTKKVMKDHARWQQHYNGYPYDHNRRYHNSQYSRNHNKKNASDRYKRWMPGGNNNYRYSRF